MNDSFRASPDRISGSITGPASVTVMQLTTPAGRPASARMSISASIDSGVWRRGLDHAGAAGGDGRAQLAGAHRHREVPRRDQQARARPAGASTRNRESAGRRGLVAAVDPHGLFGEVAEKLCGVSDFAAGLGQRLAHLQRHQQCEVVDALMQQLERAGEDVGAFAWRGRRRTSG